MLISGNAAAWFPEIPEDAGIKSPGINLFELISWADAEFVDECGNSTTVVGPGNRITILEAQPDSSANYVGESCGYLQVPYTLPPNVDHVHLRFVSDPQWNLAGSSKTNLNHYVQVVPGGNWTTWNGQAAVPGPKIPYNPAGVDPRVNYRGDWVQDPPRGDKWIGMEDYAMEGFLRFGYHDGVAPTNPSLPGPLQPEINMTSNVDYQVTFRSDDNWQVRDYSDETPAALLNVSNFEYSFPEYQNQRIEIKHVEREGRIYVETHYTANLTDDLLNQYAASVQMIMEKTMQFRHAQMPDGTIITATTGKENEDWRGFRSARVQVDALREKDVALQIMIPLTLVEQYGPGEYTLVVFDPSATHAAVEPTLLTFGTAATILPLFFAGFAGVRIRRLAKSPHGAQDSVVKILMVLVIGAIALWLAVAAILTLGPGWQSLGAFPFDATSIAIYAQLGLIWLLTGAALQQTSRSRYTALEGEIRRRAQMQSELERSNSDLKQFAHMAGHDLRAPLRAVAGYTTLLERSAENKLDDNERELMARTVKSTKKMNQMIHDLLDYSKLQTDQEPFAPLSLSEVFKDALGVLQNDIAERNAIIQYDTLPTIIGSQGQLRHLFQNLLSNAIKFTPQDRRPKIAVKSTVKNDRCTVSIRDNGIGIHSDNTEDIFETFRRGINAESIDGTGMGLAFCKRVVENHGGRIWVAETDSSGTTICFTIPGVQRAAS